MHKRCKILSKRKKLNCNHFLIFIYIVYRGSTLGEIVSNITIAVLGISFMLLMSVLGGAVVFLFRKDISAKTNSVFLGFASGIMIASSIWSLLLPAIEQSQSYGALKFLPASLGMILGTLFLVIMDKFAPKFINKDKDNGHLSKTMKLFLAVTLHNIPEGLAVGLAFGNAFVHKDAIYSALWMSIGIALQNFPETSAVSLPLKDKLKSNKKAFFYGVMSSIVDPIMAILGILISTSLSIIMPWLLAFAAGTMIFVVAEEMIPEAKNSQQSSIAGWGLIIGFVIMMILEIVVV